MKRYQLVKWFPEWVGFWFNRLDPKEHVGGLFYRWGIGLGFWELRRWITNNEEQERARVMRYGE